MAEKQKPETAVIEEQPAASASFYGTSTPKKPKSDHIGLLVTASLVVILLCTLGTLGTPSKPQEPTEQLSSEGDIASEEAAPIRMALPDDADQTAPMLRLQRQAGNEKSEEALQKLLQDSTVQVQVDFYERAEEYSGVIFTKNGYILAGCGDLREAYAISCRMRDGTEQPAAYLGYDEQTGLSLLKVCCEELSCAVFGSAAETAAGETVYSLGVSEESDLLPGRLQSSGKKELTYSGLEEVCCGAPLLNAKGSVIGLVTGTQKAAASDTLPAVVERILSANPSARLWLGFDVGEIPSLLTGFYDYPGTLWIRALPDARLEQAGLYVFDILLTADDESVNTWEEFNNVLALHQPGDEILLTIYRDGDILPVSIVVRGR